MGDAHSSFQAGAFEPHDLVPPSGTPETVDKWKAVADRLLSEQCCVFHRNAAISTHYARIYKQEPTYFKWAAMAAIASHHVRLALLPFRIHTDRTGYVDIPTSLRHGRRLLAADIDTIRSTNNAIYDDIFWVHLAYVTAENGIERLRSLLRTERHYAPVLAGFEAIDEARRLLDQPNVSQQARRAANDLIWTGNVELLRHEQRAQSCNPTLIASRLRSPASCRSDPPRRSRFEDCTRNWRISPRSTCTRCREVSRTQCMPDRFQGSPASTTVGDGW